MDVQEYLLELLTPIAHLDHRSRLSDWQSVARLPASSPVTFHLKEDRD